MLRTCVQSVEGSPAVSDEAGAVGGNIGVGRYLVAIALV